jgi:tol-pal system protein YbgF
MPLEETAEAVTGAHWMPALEDAVESSQVSPADPAKRLYDRVLEEFRRQHYEAAEAGFRLFLVLHPDSPLVPYAHYWLGESAFRLERYREAIASFDAALSDTPLHPKLAAAGFMKKGLTYAKMGERARFRQLLELVVAQFPETQEARIARESLRLPSP